MGDPREPPEGVPEGGSGNEDEYRSVVFDESFVRAARIQELSARERLSGGFGRATRPRIGFGGLGTVPRQAVALLLLIVVAFAAAVYFGISSPGRPGAEPAGSQLTVSLVALGPTSPVQPVADPAAPFAGLPAGYKDGSIGLGVPAGAATAHYTRVEVTRALDTAQRYLVASALAPRTLVQGVTTDVRGFVTTGEQVQFDQSVSTPRDDQHHAATGWMVRFDPSKIALAADTVKVAGTVRIDEADDGALQITTDHTFVYAVRAADGPATGPVTLLSVRRELRMEFDRGDIAVAQLRLVDAVAQIGPAACGTPQTTFLQPILATPGGTAPPAPPAVDPADRAAPAWQQCGVLAAH
ncbi:hypothetical protein OG689_27415 [Kitasatospora sp. NBC_00240]|uniref:SCO2583 family membrane protein n=1 Tax=Kitasatospora sp. NBC_00240 TaxID=2903567 RepID=UPI002258B7B0|nr:hypothetical protein [Kitasatospora sp. NBC_00240]MCX5212957.1 hypothetical protein [Kitasatospora sp. NBC_00240]